jgi:hypothetical protein
MSFESEEEVRKKREDYSYNVVEALCITWLQYKRELMS